MLKKTIIFIFITLTLESCGPRTGIHEETETLKTTETNVIEQISAIEKSEQNGRDIFKQNCGACHHTSAMKLIGPGLGGVLERLPKPSEAYFVKYITNYDSILKADSYAKKIRAEYRDIQTYHNVRALTTTDKLDLIAFLKTWDRPIP